MRASQRANERMSPSSARYLFSTTIIDITTSIIDTIMSFYNELPPIWALVLLLLAAVVYIVYLQPRWALRWMARQFPRVLWLDERAPLASGRKLVALTIDDAPSTWTANILDLLTIYDCRATFFVIGSYAQGTLRSDLLSSMLPG